ncbi:HypC/HybG/HupF family hydrogenase formation chaperone [Roseateles koreensis]|uniref:HypC/HybG/HupF family hydrogenase formation chaperone n=1 Tax=Roseateles koreensis TaxID=2987526 RepID=A0ABT5KT77_9BURK|nr:HypC/HybG/HupF family hydrogenase formation chaperone [Roseateles koreensis]MDC8786144.1 HypC/HybG/HupF family hydrogenase formation chaperone [Roseateles koreensis]
MCIGIPMQVLALSPGHALCQGRGEPEQLNTALLGELALGDWVLSFLGSAQERLSPQRAAEINATLDEMQALLNGAALHTEASFDLPSRMSQAEMLVLTGTTGEF